MYEDLLVLQYGVRSGEFKRARELSSLEDFGDIQISSHLITVFLPWCQVGTHEAERGMV